MKNKQEQLEEIEQRAAAKAKQREKKKRTKMSVSGKSVFRLKEIMARKSKPRRMG